MGGDQLVHLRCWFERLDVLDADDRVEEPRDARTLRRRLEHLGFTVREDGKTDALLLERLEAWLHIWKCGEHEVGVHQALLLGRGEIELQRVSRVSEAIVGELPEVLVAPHQAPQQAVLQLLGPPELRERVALPRKQLVAERGHREDVEEGPIGVKCQGLEPWLRRRRRLTAWRGISSPCCAES